MEAGIIAVLRGYKFGFGSPYPSVSGCRLSFVFLVANISNPFVVKAGYNFFCVIS